MESELSRLQERLQYSFANGALLQRAVTHRSFSAEHNERLEFLGDSVLSLAISSLLYAKLASMPEGDLSRVRANLVKEGTLHKIALKLQLPDLLRLGEGEAKSGGKQRPSILADAVEALIGAVYLDAGFAAGETVVHHLFEGVDINPHMRAADKDPKTALQELLQGKRMKLHRTKVVVGKGEPGEIAVIGGELAVCCGENAVQLIEIQPENGKRMRGSDYLRGHAIEAKAKVQ